MLPSTLPADGHIDLSPGVVLPLPRRQQVVQMGHHRVKPRHHERQGQQEGFLLLLPPSPCPVILLDLASSTSVRTRGMTPWGCPCLQGCFTAYPAPSPAPGRRAALTMCMCCEKQCTATAQPSTVLSDSSQARSSTTVRPRRWQRLRGRERECCSASSSCRAEPVLPNLLRGCSQVGPRM